ncbi:MAG: SurA N-terminal domain-containing protein [gamma proteobacterium symbiont of Taylorina sp.]|nr:SurA N-terminal domain-containing protein [gamma proteobacterium symbiont of Taylorina sp.]
MLLHSIRESATGWFAWVIVILISIPFALWGVNSYITPPNPSIASVGEYKISIQEFQNAVQNESEKYKGQIDDGLLNSAALKKVVLEKLINNRAMINYLSDAGQNVTKQQVDFQIRHDQSFQLDGQFSEDLYNRYLPNAYSKSNYRNSISTQILLQQFSNGITASSIVSDVQVKQVIELIKQKREISYALVQAEKFADSVVISEEEINNYYQNFQNQFKNPEQIKLAYLELSRQNMAKNITISDDQLEKHYQDNAAQFTSSERRRASHILFTLETDADEKTKETVKFEAQSVLEQLNSGADFTELAKEFSRDPGSAEKGGDLGFFGKGEMVPAFETVAYTMKPGEVSELVETPFGFHIIKLVEIEGGEKEPFDKVKDKIIETLQFDQIENSYFEKTESIQTMAYEQPDSLEPIAAELGLTIKESGLMSRDGSNGESDNEIFSNQKLLEAAFSLSVLEEGNNSDLIDLGDDHVVVIRVTERIPANVKPLDEVRVQIETRLKSNAISSKAQEIANEVVKLLEAGGAFSDIAEKNELTIIETGLIERQDMKTPVYIVRKAFTMPRETKYSTTKTAGADIAVIAITAIENGDSEDKELFDSVKTALLQNKGNINTALSVMQIRSETDITINDKLLNAE